MKHTHTSFKYIATVFTCLFFLPFAFFHVDAEELTTSPIKKAYAGNEYVLFLHEDTSVTGFGSNINDVLGMPKGIENNTGSAVQVSGPSGFDDLVTGFDNAFGLRYKDGEQGYELVRFNSGIGKVNETKYATLVKDFDLVGTQQENPHQSSAFVHTDGSARIKGSDYGRYLAIGTYQPLNNYPGGSTFVVDNSLESWPKVLAENGEPVLYPTTGTGYFLSNEDNTANETIKITPAFDISNNEFVVESRMRSYGRHPSEDRNYHSTDAPFKYEIFDGTLTDAQILSGTFAPLQTLNKPSASVNTGYGDRHIVDRVIQSNLGASPSKIFKIKVTSNSVMWDIRIKDRIYFENAEKIMYRNISRGYFSIIDSSGNVFVNNYWGTVKKVNFPLDVTINPNSAGTNGASGFFSILDTNGKMWVWSSTTPTLVNFPDVDGIPFYDNHKIIAISEGNGFYMAISEHKTNGEKLAWSWGSNSYGRLGLENIAEGVSVSTPTLITKNGNPLKDIQSVAAGGDFSVVVQNTSRGQLVWTAGINNSGQLGGGITLTTPKPQIIPGVKDIDRITSRYSYAYALDDTNKKIFGFGETKSFASQTSFSSLVGHPEFLSSGYEPTWLFIDENKIARILGGYDIGAVGGSYGTVKAWNGVVYDANGTDLGLNYRDLYNNGQEYFDNPKSIHGEIRQGHLIDKNGRLWGFTGTNYNTGRTGIGYWYNENGVESGARGFITGLSAVPGRQFARPAKFSQTQFADPVFEFLVGTRETSNSTLTTYAVDNQGKLWDTLGVYTTRVPAAWAVNNVKIVKGFSGWYNAFLLDENGNAWSYGDGRYGMRGINSTSSSSQPTMINPAHFNNEKIVHISAGLGHSLFVTESGDVYAAGNNSFNKLGMPSDIISTPIPLKVDGISNIVAVEAGQDFSLALDKDGRAWSWGYAASGSLGNNFSLSRTLPSTAMGNDLPDMQTLNDIETIYLSKSGRTSFSVFGTIVEKESEATKISSTIMGVTKTHDIALDEWEKDIYDVVIPQKWELTWDVNEFSEEQYLQSLTKIIGEDDRGGLVEQFFSGSFVIDNEKPQMPIWKDTCVIKNDLETCYGPNYFVSGGNNGVDGKVRLYINVPKKVGNDKAPVHPQIQFRKKQNYGYPNQWNDWIDVTTSNENGYYYEFFQGFLGEHQIRIRSMDEALNASDEQPETAYVLISNAGAEIDKIDITPASDDTNNLLNTIVAKASTSAGSGIVSYGLKRKLSTENDWVNLTEERIPNTSIDFTYVDNDESILGNSAYTYSLDAQNSVSIGKPKEKIVITNPYLPINLTKNPKEDGLAISVTQDYRNRNELLYRLVLVDNFTGQIFTKDISSVNNQEEVIFDIKDADVPFKIVNNSIQIKLLMKGLNGNFIERTYDTAFVNSPTISSDNVPPTISSSIIGSSNISKVSNAPIAISINAFSYDNVSETKNIDIQISSDATSWYGLNASNRWSLNVWTKYRGEFSNFPISSAKGKKTIYVRARDEAGNIGYSRFEIIVLEPIARDSTLVVNDSSPVATGGFTSYGNRYSNNSRVNLTVPKALDLKMVQYSLDGLTWSDWETLKVNHTKQITLTGGEGEKTVFVRFKDDYGSITDVSSNDIMSYVIDKSPAELSLETKNGTFLVKDTGVELTASLFDSLSPEAIITLNSTSLDLYSVASDGTLNAHTDRKILIQSGEQRQIVIVGLVDGINLISFKIEDSAGNVTNKSIRIVKK